MKIDIQLNSIDEIRGVLRELGLTPCRSADTPTGWVSHPIAALSKQPPSVMTVATTESAPDGGADIDIDKNFGESAGDFDSADAYARAEAVASFIIKNLLDFEAWLDERLLNDKDATVERVRFHTEVSCDGRSITMRQLTEYKNADRCKVPREDGRIGKWAVPPDDDFLEDFEAGAVRSCVSWACGELGIDIDEYLDRDGKVGGVETDTTSEASERHDVCDDIPVCNRLVRDVTRLLSRLEKWAATCHDRTLPEVFSFARVEGGCLHVHVSMPSFQPDGLTLYDNMLDFPDEAGLNGTFNLIADGIAQNIGMTFGDDMRAGFSDYVNGRPSDGQA